MVYEQNYVIPLVLGNCKLFESNARAGKLKHRYLEVHGTSELLATGLTTVPPIPIRDLT